jgi:hypothetical protein
VYKLPGWKEKPKNPAVKRCEIRVYKNWEDLKRARTQLRRQPGLPNVVDFLEVNGPALLVSERY